MKLVTLSSLIFTVFLAVGGTLAKFSPLSAVPAQIFAREGASASDSDPACSAFSSLYSSCEVATPGFSSLNPTIQVSCLCYSSSVLVPTIYDDALTSCVSYYETADPAVLTSYGILPFFTQPAYGQFWTTPCAEYSAFQSVQSIISDPGISACFSWAAIVSSCNQITPGFTRLSLSSQASCACYLSGGSVYAPLVYDGYLDTCLTYYSVHDTQLYSQLGGDHIPRTPCVAAGNVKSGVTATGTQASAFIQTQASASATAALTTLQPPATATPNQADGRRYSGSRWKMLSFSVLLLLLPPPLVFIDLI